ncbi:reverse transcriptase domain-containing protein [Chryseobacterium sp.]|uniref:reverse transcriptase domain-containing protein n=1 Tax=Chryseobacterium sp. TaxID=1871047 RepID=UPI0011CA931C|nr:reverse transcriptase domain-containing protein [Chryseobacterium sp.]TXF74979.1 RNA-directed DNA polymerase [Chryseobacterium sp.]
MVKNISIEQAEFIKKFFKSMKDLRDFCMLIDICQDILYPEFKDRTRIDEYVIKTLAHPKSKNRYHSFEIKKKNGGMRTIHAPQPELKVVLQCINLMFQTVFTPHSAAYGFVKDASVVDNANLHCGNNYVFNIDLKDFFPSIEIGRVLNRLSFPPFNFNKENGREELGNYIAWLACENTIVERLVDGKIQKAEKRVLPQGSPLSPILTNIICERLDRRLTGLAKRFGVKYSRYADDITFSSMQNVYQEEGAFRKELGRIVSDQYFIINQDKVRLQKSGTRQEVTGITVNEFSNVTRTYVKRIRLWLSFWEKFGAEKAFNLFLNGYIKDKGHVKNLGKTSFFMENVIEGKLNYLKMVKGENNSTYLGLKERFEKLSLRNKSVDQLLDTWEKNGIDEAMSKFYADPSPRVDKVADQIALL